jgi:hypothetical protein
MNIYISSLLVWIILSILAILNGFARQYLYKNKLGELRAHQLSTIILIFIFLSTIYFFINLIPMTIPQSINVGIFWLILTICFEFLFGHYIGKHSWKKLFKDYNIFKGRLWILILITISIGPYLIKKFVL